MSFRRVSSHWDTAAETGGGIVIDAGDNMNVPTPGFVDPTSTLLSPGRRHEPVAGTSG
jgi:hypothetical protein